MKVGDNAVIFVRRLRNDWMNLPHDADRSERIEIPAAVMAVHKASFTVSYKDAETGQERLKEFPFYAIPEQIRVLQEIPVYPCGVEGCTNKATISIALPEERYARFCGHCAGHIAVMVDQGDIG